MESIQPTVTSRQPIVAALSIGSVALLMIGLQPILLGAMVDTRHATLEGVGVIAMSEIVALGIGVVLGDALLPVGRLRIITLLAALIISGFDVLTARLTGDTALAAVRAAAGLGEGVLVWVTTCVIVRSRTADRLAGVFLTVQTLAQASVAAVFARAVIPHGGWQGGFAMLGALALVPCVLSLRLPTTLKPISHHASRPFVWSVISAMPLLIAFVQMAAIGSLWAYLEPIGQRAGLDAQAAQTAVSAVLFTQVAGGIAAAGAVRYVDNMLTLIGGAIALALIPIGMHVLPAGHTASFIALCGVFGFVWLFLMPFHIGLALRLDRSGRVATLAPGVQLLGTAFGPLVSSLVVKGDDASPVPFVTLGFSFTAIVVATTAYILRRRSACAPRTLEESNAH
ncbi:MULTISPECIES: MFS transporter [Paraburkholderia]|uniref:MFS transporter n=1 Tax=Paraburkholderia TaxID=1822464 RepID=UPI002252DED7|nr:MULTISPECIES: MFS transporter [Paraburkholderia]MCX4157682.1 MFS transporter [Paraburkholderia aspalathi]MDN7167084.1 MFS transporter [Paraburkholderia sp. SECH2]MDQ6395572.1 MFS transporter [Paraburkholderia aspalathi]